MKLHKINYTVIYAIIGFFILVYLFYKYLEYYI
jgi:hypothetical protein